MFGDVHAPPVGSGVVPGVVCRADVGRHGDYLSGVFYLVVCSAGICESKTLSETWKEDHLRCISCKYIWYSRTLTGTVGHVVWYSRTPLRYTYNHM